MRSTTLEFPHVEILSSSLQTWAAVSLVSMFRFILDKSAEVCGDEEDDVL